MSLLSAKNDKQSQDEKSEFWLKVERIYGEIPVLIRLILDYNGFDSFLALRGISSDDKTEFFNGIEESIRSLQDYDDDELKVTFEHVLKHNHQRIDNFRLKLGHKYLITNLCRELQSTSLEDFYDFRKTDKANESDEKVEGSPQHEIKFEDKQDEELSEEIDEVVLHKIQLPQELDSAKNKIEINEAPEISNGYEDEEMVQYIYESDGEEETIQFTDQEYLEPYDQDVVVEEVYEIPEAENDENLYMSEDIVKSEPNSFDNSSNMFDVSSSSSRYKFKRPKHMYTEEFLAKQKTQGRIGIPGKRRPKLNKKYPDTEEGLLERWADLIRQSCEVIVPTNLLQQYDLSDLDIVKTQDLTWEIKCPMCSKKVRLQMTYEGKYINYKRSNFERHLRIIHYRQIEKAKDNSQFSKKSIKSEDEHEDEY